MKELEDTTTSNASSNNSKSKRKLENTNSYSNIKSDGKKTKTKHNTARFGDNQTKNKINKSSLKGSSNLKNKKNDKFANKTKSKSATPTTKTADTGAKSISKVGKHYVGSVVADSNQKQQLQEQSNRRPRKHDEIVSEGKKIWNILRMKKTKNSSNHRAKSKSSKNGMDEDNEKDFEDDKMDDFDEEDVIMDSDEDGGDKIVYMTDGSSKTKESLVLQLISLIQGKIYEISLQHDASRIVQAIVQFGTQNQRRGVLMELLEREKSPDDKSAQSNSIIELCKNRYGHFVIAKLIKYCASDNWCVTKLAKAMRGSIPKLAFHAVASRIVENMFQYFPVSATTPLKQELYGPHFTLFAATSSFNTVSNKNLNESVAVVAPTLQTNIALYPEKRDATIDYFRTLVYKGMDKSLYSYAFFQQMLHEYLSVLEPYEIRDMLTASTTSTSSVVDHCLELVRTRAGASVVATLIAYGTPKERRRIARCFKGYTRSALLHKDAFVAVLRLVQLNDDTVAIHKNILAELLLPPTSAVMDGSSSGISTTDRFLSSQRHHNKAAKSKQQKADSTTTNAADGLDATETISPPTKGTDTDTRMTTGDAGVNTNAEMMATSPLLDLALSDTGSKLFRMLLLVTNNSNENDEEVMWNKIFDPYERSVLFLNPTIIEKNQQQKKKSLYPNHSNENDDVPTDMKDIDDSETEHAIPTSKKNSAVRRMELLKPFQQPLIELCCQHTAVLLRSVPGSYVLRDVYKRFRSEKLSNALVHSLLPNEQTSMQGNGKGFLSFDETTTYMTFKHIITFDQILTATESSETHHSDNDLVKDDGETMIAGLFTYHFLKELSSPLMCETRSTASLLDFILTSNRWSGLVATMVQTMKEHQSAKQMIQKVIDTIPKSKIKDKITTNTTTNNQSIVQTSNVNSNNIKKKFGSKKHQQQKQESSTTSLSATTGFVALLNELSAS